MTILDVSIFMNETSQVVSILIFIACQGDAWVDIVGYLKGGQLFSSFTKIGYKFCVFVGTGLHYYILCLFAKGQTKNLKGLRSKNKKPEGFAKQK